MTKQIHDQKISKKSNHDIEKNFEQGKIKDILL